MFRVAVLTLSDSSFAGKREDESGPLIEKAVLDFGYVVVDSKILPDEQNEIEQYLKKIADNNTADLILTTGGTGFSKRDRTPEATIAVCERLAPAIPTAITEFSLKITPRAMLSRAAAGIRGETLIVNLPGSPKAVCECLDYIMTSLDHGLEVLTGKSSNCAR